MVNWWPMASQHRHIPRSFTWLSALTWITIAIVCWRVARNNRVPS